VVTVLAAYKVNQLNAENTQPSALALKWSVLARKAVAFEATGQPGTPFIYKPQIDSIIRAEIIGAQSQLGSASVHVATSAAPTPTTEPVQATPPATAQASS
jgi:hypothetical protein